ncbi:MAG: hypothetical protein JWN75_1232 [Candidatus Saccharibacteria bacterium]|nr:hypothetical protein [Candidatus Saccharibacteria bacterium]
MTKIINIRGCNGAGKTTLVRKLIEAEPLPIDVVIASGYLTPGHYLPETRTLIVGPYKPGKATGGMDNVNTTDEAKAAVAAGALGLFGLSGEELCHGPPRAVVFEGVLISTVYQTWVDFARENGGMKWAFLRTDVEECIRRVKERRAAKGRPEEGFKEKLVRDKHRSIESVRRKAIAAGLLVTDLTPGYELETLQELING